MQYRICSFHFLYTRLILDLMRPSVDRWSPLTHTSHCMTTSRPAAAMQMRVRACPAMHPKLFLCQMPFLPQTSLFLGLGTGSHTETSRCTEIYFTSELVCYEISAKCYTAHISVTHFNNSGTFLHVNLTTCLTITLTLLLTSFNLDKISRAKPSASPRFVPTATHATSVTTLCNIMYATYMLQWYYEISNFVKSLVILCNYWNLLTVLHEITEPKPYSSGNHE